MIATPRARLIHTYIWSTVRPNVQEEISVQVVRERLKEKLSRRQSF